MRLTVMDDSSNVPLCMISNGRVLFFVICDNDIRRCLGNTDLEIMLSLLQSLSESSIDMPLFFKTALAGMSES